ncbi:MAG TPA: SulP family inorganic anion transporter [Casimicrobiaceae bacterium]|nr:SulP family inorganic anion transporter [Casimicrobiaceae bacterium]
MTSLSSARRSLLRRRYGRARIGESTPVSLRGEVIGGAAGATASLALALSLGLLAFAPLGAAHARVGVAAGFASAIYGQFVAGVLGAAAHPGSGPRASASLVLGGLVAVLCADPALAPTSALGVERVIALAGLAVVLSGFMQIVAGALGAGLFARYVPYPFIAGFMCGASALIVITQFTPLTGVTHAELASHPFTALRAIQPVTLFVGLATLAIIVMTARFSKRMPAALIGLVAGTLIYYGIVALLPGMPTADVVGLVPSQLPLPTALAPLLDIPQTTMEQHLPHIASTAAVIAIIGTLDGLFAAVAVDHATDGRHGPHREVIAHGIANVVSGLCGGVPVVYSRARAMTSWNAGGRTALTAVIAAFLLAAVLVVGARPLALIPLASLAGIMLSLAVGLIDTWTHGILRRLRRRGALRDRTLVWSAITVLLVALTAVFFGFVLAIVVGLALSCLLFFVTMNRSLVRSVVDGTIRPSRRVWGGRAAERINAARKRIRIIELEGALFFGSGERLSEQVERFGAEVDAVVLDFRRVTAIDATGALLVERLVRRLAARRIWIALAGVTPGGRHGAAFTAHGTFRDTAARPWFRDADQAIEAAERVALQSNANEERDEVAIADFALVQGIEGHDLTQVIQRLHRRAFAAGETLFRENDPGDLLCLIARGAVGISISAGSEEVRIVTMAEGSLLGEAALLDGRPRSATARAVEDTVVYELSREDLDSIAAQHPTIAIRIMGNLARIMSQRMRETNEILRQLYDTSG